MNLFYKNKGAISIFLVIILVPMLTISAIFVDVSKVMLGKGVAESAADLALNTALTNYDTTLKDMYGLFATAQDMDELFAKLEEYYRTSITSSGVSEADANVYVDQIMAELGLIAENNETADLLNMELIDFEVSKRTDATLANATVLKKQIVDFMKYRSPINTGLSFLSAIESFTTLSKQTELVEKRTAYYEAQEDVMNDAQSAWKYINTYNKSPFITDDTYFSTMVTDFGYYESVFYDFSEEIIKNLYDTQNYDTFSAYSYEEVEEWEYSAEYDEEMTEEELEEVTNYYNECLTAYTTALNNYTSAYPDAETICTKLTKYDNETYGLQFLVQMNRKNLYNPWTSSIANLREKYVDLRLAAACANKDVTSQIESYTACESVFTTVLSNYNSTLQGYASSIGLKTTSTALEASIRMTYDQITAYRKAVSDAKTNLEQAVVHLNNVLEDVKSGGTLDKKKGEWNGVAIDSDLANTSMAKQDLAEIDSLSTYLNEDDVQTLITRLNNMITNFGSLLNQIDSYTFFEISITDIDSYSTLTYILKSNIGDTNLKNVPTNTALLDDQVTTWTSGKFVVGTKVNVDWINQSNTQVKLIQDKPNFYSYLYTHFNVNSGTVTTDTTEKTESKENGRDLYKNIKDKANSNANTNAESANDGNISTVDEEGNSKEIKNQKELPSNGTTTGTADAKISTGETAVSDTKGSLSTMFTSLGKAIVDMGADLRDKLYISDYILGMFSYDTIEKEYKVDYKAKNGGVEPTEIKLQTITLQAINDKNNFAYGKEVEYIIYGGTNTTNLVSSYGSIYGIRLGFNLVYAFMDSSIRDTAFAIATPISAATLGVIPVPLIQAAIIIGIACCESGLDLMSLRDGESIPIFKNNKTWKCSIRGLVNEVKAEVGEALVEVGNAAIDIGTEKLGEYLDMTDEQLTEAIKGGTDDIKNAVGASYDTLITNNANTAIQKLTTLCNNAIEEYMLNPEVVMIDFVTNGLDKWLVQEGEGVDKATDLSYIVKEEAVGIIKDGYIQPMLDTLQANAANAEATVAEAANAVTTVINRVRKEITDKIIKTSEKVLSYKKEMKNQIEESMKGGAANLKKTLNSQINGVFGSSNAVAGAKTDATGVASLLSFTYSDYLRLFLMIGLYTNEQGILLRTADAIQVNMEHVGNSGYRLKKSAVYLELSATVQVKPTLLALPLFAEVESNPSTNQGWYTFENTLLKGY